MSAGTCRIAAGGGDSCGSPWSGTPVVLAALAWTTGYRTRTWSTGCSAGGLGDGCVRRVGSMRCSEQRRGPLGACRLGAGWPAGAGLLQARFDRGQCRIMGRNRERSSMSNMNRTRNKQHGHPSRAAAWPHPLRGHWSCPRLTNPPASKTAFHPGQCSNSALGPERERVDKGCISSAGGPISIS